MKHKKTIIGVVLMTLLTSNTYAKIETKLDYRHNTKVEQFCFGDTVVKNEKLIESNIITVSSTDNPVEVEIKGRGEYSINGKDMKRNRAMVKNGDRIQLRHRSLDVDGAKVSTTLVVGDVYDVFTTVTNRGGRSEEIYKIDTSPCQL